MAEVLKKFGRYFLLDRLAQGGMAEIYRARLASADGAGRLIVIKRIQAGYGSNAEFLQMFKSEIKVTMGLNHPNIVQLFDFGEEQAQPYIVMELVDGKNLRQFITRFSELRQTFPIDLAAYIIEQAASGLHYAHSFKDKITGQPLNIIHRDISPQNILISYEGSVKIIDFGIAKATTNSESTRAGVIKGKPSYLSPEQISGEALDARSDIFSLGTVLWELLTSKKLFAGENDLAVLKLIESCQSHVKPPSTLNSNVPKELDYIVLRALAKQREKRFQTSEELQRALHKFLYSYSPDFNPSDLSYHAKDLFKDEIVEDRKQIQRLNDKVENLLGTDLPEIIGGTQGTKRGKKQEDTTTVVEQKPKPTGAREVFNPNAIKDSRIEVEPVNPAVSLPRGPGIERRSRTQTSNRSRSFSTNTALRSGSRRSVLPSVVLATLAMLVISYFGPDTGFEVPILSHAVRSFLGKESSVQTVVKDAQLLLQGNQTGVTISMNGQVIGNVLPFAIKPFPIETNVHIAVTGSKGSFQKDVSLKKGEFKSLEVNLTSPTSGSTQNTASIEAGETQSGESPSVSNAPSSNSPEKQTAEVAPKVVVQSTLLKLNIQPAGVATSVLLNNRKLDLSYPMATVPLDKPLDLYVKTTRGFKNFEREFFLDSHEVGGHKEWRMDVQLESSDPTQVGYLTIRTTPSASIKINGKDWGKRTPLENERLKVGTYEITLYSEALGAEKKLHVTIQNDKRVVIEDVRWDFSPHDRKPSGN